jgi:hypothetical protein
MEAVCASEISEHWATTWCQNPKDDCHLKKWKRFNEIVAVSYVLWITESRYLDWVLVYFEMHYLITFWAAKSIPQQLQISARVKSIGVVKLTYLEKSLPQWYWTCLQLFSLGLCGQRLASNCISHGTARFISLYGNLECRSMYFTFHVSTLTVSLPPPPPLPPSSYLSSSWMLQV